MKPFTFLTTMFLLFLAGLQATRFFLGWDVNINHVEIPVWVSGVIAVAIGGLSVMLWKENRK